MAGRESSGNRSGEQGGRSDHAGVDGVARIPRYARDDKRIAGGGKPISPRELRGHSVDLGRTENKAASSRRTPKERRGWERVVEKKKEKRRNKYRAVRGKVVDWVEHWIEDAYLFVGIRFKDKTHLWLQFGAKIVTDEIDLCDASDGSLRVVRQIFRREDL